MSEWIAVKDRMPENDVDVLVTDGKAVLVGYLCKSPFFDAAKWGASGVEGYEWEWEFDVWRDGEEVITHWMELPAIP